MSQTPELEKLVSQGSQLFSQQKFLEAASTFAQATRLEPSSVSAWINLTAAYIHSDQTDLAIEAGQRAVAIGPNVAPAFANLGDAYRVKSKGDQALGAYQRAVELAPNNADFLNRLGASLHVVANFKEAEAILSKALTVAPQHYEARINYISTLLALGESNKATTIMQQGASLAGAPAAFRQRFEIAANIHQKNNGLTPAITEAVEKSTPERLLLGSEQVLSPHPDQLLISRLVGCLENLPLSSTDHQPLRESERDLFNLLEAHSSAHLGDSAEDTARSIKQLKRVIDSGDLPSGLSAERNIIDALHYYQAIQHYWWCREHFTVTEENISLWIRYWHAVLTSHRSEMGPGLFKIVPNTVTVNPFAPRTTPEQIISTLKTVFANHYSKLDYGPARAIIVYFSLADIHPFPDGNGRLGRFLMNRELELAGLCPVADPRSLKYDFWMGLKGIRQEHSFQKFSDWLAKCDTHNQQLKNDVIRLADQD